MGLVGRFAWQEAEEVVVVWTGVAAGPRSQWRRWKVCGRGGAGVWAGPCLAPCVRGGGPWDCIRRG